MVIIKTIMGTHFIHVSVQINPIEIMGGGITRQQREVWGQARHLFKKKSEFKLHVEVSFMTPVYSPGDYEIASCPALLGAFVHLPEQCVKQLGNIWVSGEIHSCF